MTVNFSATDDTSSVTYFCALDSTSFPTTPCPRPFVAQVLKGAHTLNLRAVDATDLQSETSVDFTIKSGKIK